MAGNPGFTDSKAALEQVLRAGYEQLGGGIIKGPGGYFNKSGRVILESDVIEQQETKLLQNQAVAPVIEEKRTIEDNIISPAAKPLPLGLIVLGLIGIVLIK